MLTPHTIYEQLTTSGDEWVDAFSVAERARQKEKSTLSILMKLSDEKSISAKELDAESDGKYLDACNQLVEAHIKEMAAKIKYERVKIMAEIWRTEAANQRAAAGRAV